MPHKGDDGALLDNEKRQRRQEAIAVREALPHEERARASEVISRAIAALLHERRTERATPLRVATYWPIRSEVDIRSLASLAPADTVFLYPRVVPGPPALEFAPGALTHVGSFGIPEPTLPAEPIATLDVVIVPGLLFGRAGERLGYGKGYYDRVLAQLPADAISVGVAFEAQIGIVPVGPHDRPVARVVTDAGTRFRRD